MGSHILGAIFNGDFLPDIFWGHHPRGHFGGRVGNLGLTFGEVTRVDFMNPVAGTSCSSAIHFRPLVIYVSGSCEERPD